MGRLGARHGHPHLWTPAMIGAPPGLAAMRCAPVCHSVRAATKRGLRRSAGSRVRRGSSEWTPSAPAPTPLPLLVAALTEQTEGQYGLRSVKEGLQMQCAVASKEPCGRLGPSSLDLQQMISEFPPHPTVTGHFRPLTITAAVPLIAAFRRRRSQRPLLAGLEDPAGPKSACQGANSPSPLRSDPLGDTPSARRECQPGPPRREGRFSGVLAARQARSACREAAERHGGASQRGLSRRRPRAGAQPACRL